MTRTSPPVSGTLTPCDRFPASRSRSRCRITDRALRPRSSLFVLNLSSSSITSKGMMTSLSANRKSAAGLWSSTFVSRTKCLIPSESAMGQEYSLGTLQSKHMLYPFKFQPRLLEKMWGGRKLESILHKKLPADKPIGESWELYDFPPGVLDNSSSWTSSIISNGPLAGQSLHQTLEDFGPSLHGEIPLLKSHNQFPLLIKFLDAKEILSVQVHPGNHDLKTEAWYVIDAAPGAFIYKGLKKGVDRGQLQAALENGTVENLLNKIPAR